MLKDLAGAIASFDRCNPSWGRDQDGDALFSPDVLTSAQYYAAPVASPHHRLLLAILEDAIRCFQRNFAVRNGPRRILFRETEEWLFDSDGTAFLSCAMVCESLGINPVELRRSLHRWRIREGAGQVAPCLARRRPVTGDPHRISPDVYRTPTTPTVVVVATQGNQSGPGSEALAADAHQT
jgi:hypothetical protein